MYFSPRAKDMNKNSSTKCKKLKHLMTPFDALCVIQRLKNAVPNVGTEHIAFALGVSRGQLCKFLKHLSQIMEGVPSACENYNTRSQFMRELFLLDNSSDLTVKFIMEDALLYGSKGNIASARGRTSESANIIGLSCDELISTQSELDYLDEEEVTLEPLQLLLKKKLPSGMQVQIPIKAEKSRDTYFHTFCKKRKLSINDANSRILYNEYKSQLDKIVASSNVTTLELS